MSAETRHAVRRLLRLARLDKPSPTNTTDPVAYADQQTSLADARAALCLASGVPVELIGPMGHDMSTGSAR